MSDTADSRMFLISTGPGPRKRTPLGVTSTYQLAWAVREEGPEGKPVPVRTPSERRKKYSRILGFPAAGRRYLKFGQLIARKLEGQNLYLDRYGREVFCYVHRFPCFDSFDAIHEHRFERWFLLCEGGKLTCVRYTDETNYIEVSEDVEVLEYNVWDEMKRRRWHTEAP